MSLDISIPNIITTVFGPKTKPFAASTTQTKAKSILTQPILIQEKVDGTKLTLIRTSKCSPLFWENWIVSYKDMILNYSEFEYLLNTDLETIRTQSTGISQYAIVFDHLRKINHVISNIPHNTEFSVEFAQNKNTLTRTYNHFGALFLRSFSPTEYFENNGMLVSIPTREEMAYSRIHIMANLLQLQTFPVWASGWFDSKSNAIAACKHPKFKQVLANSQLNWNDKADIICCLATAAKKTPSILGGLSEGAVFTLQSGQMFKAVQNDQYDKVTRQSKKETLTAEYAIESVYFSKLRGIISAIQSNIHIHNNELSQILLAADVNKNNIDIALPHPKKHLRGKLDDLHETAKLMQLKQRVIGQNTVSLGLIPIAGKPFHLGHFKLIELASHQNDTVIVYISTGDRKRHGQLEMDGNSAMLLWKTYYLNIMPPNVKVQFVKTPVQSVFYELQWMDQLMSQDNVPPPSIRLYSDNKDIFNNFPTERLTKYAPNLVHKITPVGMSRTTTANISGSEMREFLQTKNKELYMRYLPPVSIQDKLSIWNKTTSN